MDVHPPHEPIHTWRDFFLHLTTITIGLFIALMLEAGVEYLHHKQVVREAKEKLRQEITDNRKSIQKDIASVEAAKGRMSKNIETLNALRLHPKLDHVSLSYNLQWDSPSDSVWNAARDTGALSLMNYRDLQGYTDVYAQQRIVNDWAVRMFSEQLTAAAPIFAYNDPVKLTPDERATVLHSTAVLYAQLMGLEQISKELADTYAKALQPQ